MPRALWKSILKSRASSPPMGVDRIFVSIYRDMVINRRILGDNRVTDLSRLIYKTF